MKPINKLLINIYFTSRSLKFNIPLLKNMRRLFLPLIFLFSINLAFQNCSTKAFNAIGSEAKTTTQNCNTQNCAVAAPTVTISFYPALIMNGASTTVTWSSTNAIACSTSFEGRTGSSLPVSGSNVIVPTSTDTMTLTCTGPGGSASASALVTVQSQTSTTVNGPITFSFAGTTQMVNYDLYYPKNYSATSNPVVILIHGGGWFAGSRNDNPFPSLAVALADNGFFVYNMDYTLNTPPQPISTDLANPNDVASTPFNAGLNDIAIAVTDFVNSITQNNSTYHLNLNKVSILGASAGAYIALYQSMRNDNPVTFNCVADLFGPTDLDAVIANTNTIPVSAQFVRHTFGSNSSILASFSPATITNNFKGNKLFILHATNDNLVPVSQSYELYNNLQNSKPGVKITTDYRSSNSNPGWGQLQTFSNISHAILPLDYGSAGLNYLVSNCK